MCVFYTHTAYPYRPSVLQRLWGTKRGDLAKVSKETGIPYSTFSRWHYGLMHDVHFNSLAKMLGENKW